MKKNFRRNLEYITTGMAPLDNIMGGGIPLGRAVQFSGAHSTGKTTTAYMSAANAQKMGIPVIWFDTEKRFEYDFAESLGVDLDEIEIIYEEIAENIFKKMLEKAGEKKCLLVLDSVGGLHTKKEAESGMDVGYPDAPKLIPVFMRHLVVPLDMKRSAAILLNHEKTDFNGALKVLGGKSTEYHCTTWVRFRRAGKGVMEGEKEIATYIEAKIWKGKYFHQTCTLCQKYTGGFDMELMLADNAINAGIITKEGKTYYFDGEKVCVGLGALREKFKESEFAELIKSKLNVP